ncbi:hypothetical protein AAMO2058_001129000 [Amorphochlora amoebiformis]
MLRFRAARLQNPTPVRTDRVPKSLSHSGSFFTISPQNRYIISGSKLNMIGVWEYYNDSNKKLQLGKDVTVEAQVFSGHHAPIRALCFSPDSSKVISASGNAIYIWDFLGQDVHPEKPVEFSTSGVIEDLDLKEEKGDPAQAIDSQTESTERQERKTVSEHEEREEKSKRPTILSRQNSTESLTALSQTTPLDAKDVDVGLGAIGSTLEDIEEDSKESATSRAGFGNAFAEVQKFRRPDKNPIFPGKIETPTSGSLTLPIVQSRQGKNSEGLMGNEVGFVGELKDEIPEFKIHHQVCLGRGDNMVWSSNSNTLAHSCGNLIVIQTLFEANVRKQRVIRAHAGSISTLSFSNDGSMLASGSATWTSSSMGDTNQALVNVFETQSGVCKDIGAICVWRIDHMHDPHDQANPTPLTRQTKNLASFEQISNTHHTLEGIPYKELGIDNPFDFLTLGDNIALWTILPLQKQPRKVGLQKYLLKIVRLVMLLVGTSQGNIYVIRLEKVALTELLYSLAKR